MTNIMIVIIAVPDDAGGDSGAGSNCGGGSTAHRVATAAATSDYTVNMM